MTAALAAQAAQAQAARSFFGADADQILATRAGTATPGTPDPVTGLVPAPARTTVYQGPARLRTPGAVSAGRRQESAGDQATLLTTILSVPASAPRLAVNDRVEFLSSANSALVGMLFTVSGLIPSSHVSAQRVSVTAVID